MKQEFDQYTADDLKVWNKLFTRQLLNLQDKACEEYLLALQQMNAVLNPNELPNFEKINAWFTDQTGWTIACVPGLIPVDEFFILLANKQFPSSTWLRSMDKLDYLEEPDMFHDIFGHVPLLANKEYSDFIEMFGKIGLSMIHNEAKLIELQRLYWFTIEFGLLTENNTHRIYGAGILSSFGESISSLTRLDVERPSFDLTTVLQTSFCSSEIQSKYFVCSGISALRESILPLFQSLQNEPISIT